MKDAYTAYKTANIDTADQGKLILICYDVAIKHCRLSLEYFDSYENIEQRSKCLYKVQDAVGELMGSLRLDAGEIANNLYRLYDYIIRRVIYAGAKGDKAPIIEVLKYLEDLREAWREAIIQGREQKNPENAANIRSIAVSG